MFFMTRAVTVTSSKQHTESNASESGEEKIVIFFGRPQKGAETLGS
jgi:hypothetical protein